MMIALRNAETADVGFVCGLSREVFSRYGDYSGVDLSPSGPRQQALSMAYGAARRRLR